jgi:hypothetical protein
MYPLETGALFMGRSRRSSFITTQYSIKIWALPTILLKGLKSFFSQLSVIAESFVFLYKISHIILLFIYISAVVLWTVFVLSSKRLSPIFLTYECQQENKFTWRLFAAKELH